MSIGTKLTAAKSVVTSSVATQLFKTKKHSPTILFGVGVIGVATTTVLACKATLKLEDVLNEHDETHEKMKAQLAFGQENYTQRDFDTDVKKLKYNTTREIVLMYGPAVLVGVASIVALTSSHVILTRRNAGLMVAYTALDRGMKEYHRRVVDEVGEEKARELRFGTDSREIAVQTDKGVQTKTVKHAKDGKANPYAMIFGPDTSRSWKPYPDHNYVFLRAVQQTANDNLQSKGFVFLNDVLNDLGIEKTSAGAITGWLRDGEGDGYIDFGIFDEGNEAAFFDFMTGRENVIWLDFNVDGSIWDKI